LCLANVGKRIFFLSEAYHGRVHDYAILKHEFAPGKADWFGGFELLVDLGFLGIEKDYEAKVRIPVKKPRKKELAEEQKGYNKSVSKIRVKIEHSIGGLKRYRILSDRLRMRNMARYNQVSGICAGLWNFILTN